MRRVIGAKSLTGSNGTLAKSAGPIALVLIMKPNVYPSLLALATALAPIMPLAPARLSITTACLNASVSFGPIRRARMSVVPPGGKFTIKRIGLLGKSASGCAACAGPEACAANTSADAAMQAGSLMRQGLRGLVRVGSGSLSQTSRRWTTQLRERRGRIAAAPRSWKRRQYPAGRADDGGSRLCRGRRSGLERHLRSRRHSGAHRPAAAQGDRRDPAGQGNEGRLGQSRLPPRRRIARGVRRIRAFGRAEVEQGDQGREHQGRMSGEGSSATRGDVMKRWIGFTVGMLIPGLIMAQSWPSKPIRIVIAQAPGSATDVISRVVGNQLSEALGQPIVIDARPGAGGVLGTEVAARSAPDGYTLFMANNSTHGSNPAVYAKLPYDAVRDFAPISFVASVPYVLVVDPALPVKTVQEFIALVKSRPGKMNYASAGNGSTHHFCGELLKSMTGIDIQHIPYKGSGPGIAGLLGGEVSMMFSNVADIGSQIRAGKVRPLAVTVPKRATLLPDVPTMPEAGLADFEITSWFGLLAPAGTPSAIVGRLNAETVKVLERADVKTTLTAQGLEVAPSSPEQFAAHIKSEIARFTKIAKAAGIKAEQACMAAD